ncbi:hypothetical protein TNIN_28651 [Trichonephila inaurata madagascariensis]|uniref:Uncharacterized protein n=1 Tax=Trichonephila inaurata madagascariensis TaxID=2747483 RepID=A0A8X6WNM4_9ARAC|nr:hypothetical protein TNIN_28651 [Trichonephila inaurata madagascariensis]
MILFLVLTDVINLLPLVIDADEFTSCYSIKHTERIWSVVLRNWVLWGPGRGAHGNSGIEDNVETVWQSVADDPSVSTRRRFSQLKTNENQPIEGND